MVLVEKRPHLHDSAGRDAGRPGAMPRHTPPPPNPPMPEEGITGPVTLPHTRPGVTSPGGPPAISVGDSGETSFGDGGEWEFARSPVSAIPSAPTDARGDDVARDSRHTAGGEPSPSPRSRPRGRPVR